MKQRIRFILLPFISVPLLAFLAAPCWSQSPQRDIETRQQLRQAIEAAEHGQFEKAKAIDDLLLSSHPNFLPALKLRGSLLEQAGQADKAAEVYAAALQSAPKDAGLLMKLGLYSLSLHDNDRAVEYLLRYATLKPADPDGLFYLAQAYHFHAQPDRALETMHRCVQLAPANAQFLQKYGELLTTASNSSEASRWLLKAQRIDSSLDKLDFDLALAFYYQLDFSRAALYAAKAIVVHPGDLKSQNLLASAREKLLDWQAAAVAYQAILSIQRDSPSARLGLGHCQLELGQQQAAIDSIQQALRSDPALPFAHFYLARAYRALGRPAEARHESDLHQKMQQMSFAPPALESESGRAAWQRATQAIEAGHEDEAIRQLSENVSGPSRKPADVLVLAGSLCFSLGRTEQGELLLHRALALQPSVRGAHTYLGLAALQRAEILAAENEFETELVADPNYLPASEGLGAVRYRQQLWEQAATLLTASRTTSPAALYMLADSYFHLGNAQNARLTAEIGAAYARNQPEIAQSFAALLVQYGETSLAARLFPAATGATP